MPYYVVNHQTGPYRVGSGTHIMKARVAPHGLSPLSMWLSTNPSKTLCGRVAARYVNVFQPQEASCRECRKRYQIALAADAREVARRATLTPEQRTSEDRSKMAAKLVGLLLVAFVVIMFMAATHHL